jgi:hypothetical protein
MKIYALDICPTETKGLCNQIYSIVASIQYCINNKINIIFIGKFLKSINSNRYCNISEIININKFNKYLSKYNVFICDINNYNFRIDKAELINGKIIKNVKELINNNYYNDNQLYINKNTTFYMDNYFKDDNNSDHVALKIKYLLDDGFFTENYSIINNRLNENIDYNFKSLKFESNFVYKHNEIFVDIIRNIPFSDIILNNSFINNSKLLKNIKTNIINTIHLRIEDDVFEHFSEKLNVKKEIIKKNIENTYINTIQKYLNKSDLIVVLTYSQHNSVLDFLKKNNYTYVISNEKEEDREISGIYDLLLGEICNNYYIFVYESSFSYSVLYRIKNKNIKGIQIYYENLNKEPDQIYLKY